MNMAPPPILLLTRPEAAARDFAARLGSLPAGTDTVIAPLIGIAPVGPLPEIAPGAHLIFTSANGVRAYAAMGGPPGRDAYTVGDATAAAARAAGLVARSAAGDAEALFARIRTEAPAAPLLHLRGTHARGDLAARLAAAGLQATETVIYDQPRLPPPPAARAALAGCRPVVAPLFSPRSAEAFAVLAPVAAPLYIAAMSMRVAEAARPAVPRRMSIADRPDADAMAALTARLLTDAAALEGRGGAE